MEATYSTETSVDFQRTTRCCIPEDRTLHNHRCENLRSYVLDDFGRLWYISQIYGFLWARISPVAEGLLNYQHRRRNINVKY
jgi:streptogramin lyase